MNTPEVEDSKCTWRFQDSEEGSKCTRQLQGLLSLRVGKNEDGEMKMRYEWWRKVENSSFLFNEKRNVFKIKYTKKLYKCTERISRFLLLSIEQRKYLKNKTEIIVTWSYSGTLYLKRVETIEASLLKYIFLNGRCTEIFGLLINE